MYIVGFWNLDDLSNLERAETAIDAYVPPCVKITLGPSSTIGLTGVDS